MQPTDDDIPDSMTPEQRREDRHFQRHNTMFALGFVPMLVGAIIGAAFGRSVIATVILLLVSASCWVVSGVSAIAAKRHLFGGMGTSGVVYTRVRPSGRDSTGAMIVGVMLFLLALGLVAVAVRIATTAT